MLKNRNISRVLAAAVASAGLAAVPVPSLAVLATKMPACTSFSATPDGAGNTTIVCGSPAWSFSCTAFTAYQASGVINVNCTNPKDASSDPTSPPPPPPPPPPNSPPPPPSGGAIDCSASGYAKTIVIDLPWGPPKSAAPRIVSSGFGNGVILVARFTTPSATSLNAARIHADEWTGGTILRTGALSDRACDLTGDGLGPYVVSLNSTNPRATYTVGGNLATAANLKPNTTYYFNVVNEAYGAQTCRFSACEVAVELDKPSGL